MKIAPLPTHEAERLAALRRYQIVDSEFESDYQEVAELAATICGTPIALVSLIEEDRQWFKARVGLEASESSRDIAFCSHAILQEGVMEVTDALTDERFADNPLVTADPRIRFYAGVPLRTRDGHALGTLCTIDRKPRQLTQAQNHALRVLARQVCNQLELRLANRQLKEQAERLETLNANRNRLFRVIAHDLKSPFQGLLSITEMLDSSLESFSQDQVRRYLGLLRNSTGATYTLLENLLQWALFETDAIAFEPVSLELARELHRAVDVLRTTIERKKQTLDFNLHPDLRLRADPKMLQAIIRNLVANAVKFSPPGATIRVQAQRTRDAIRLTVQDAGTGMTEEKQRALVEGGDYHSSTGTAGEEGTGLGFRLVRQFAERHRAIVAIDSAPGKGTLVTVTFPLS